MARHCELADGSFFDPKSSREYCATNGAARLYRTFQGAFVLWPHEERPRRVTNLEACRWLLEQLHNADEMPDELKHLACGLIV
jgi:hypothetical protein